MKAEIGDYIRFSLPGSDKKVISKVIDIVVYTIGENYETANGWCISENELGIDDVLLPSEVEIDS